jgi:hypothetical protein
MMFTFIENMRPDLEDLEQPTHELDCYFPFCGIAIPDDEINEFGTCATCLQAEIDSANESELIEP